MIFNGNISGTGITALLGGYALSTDVNKKENSITVVSPLVKTVSTGVNQLSLDTGAAYTVGSLTTAGQILCGNIGTGPDNLVIQTPTGLPVATFFNNADSSPVNSTIFDVNSFSFKVRYTEDRSLEGDYVIGFKVSL